MPIVFTIGFSSSSSSSTIIPDYTEYNDDSGHPVSFLVVPVIGRSRFIEDGDLSINAIPQFGQKGCSVGTTGERHRQEAHSTISSHVFRTYKNRCDY